MEKIFAKDQATYSKERDGFVRDLQHFHETRGTPIKRAPTLGGKEVDLYLLYMLVTSQGGWLRVNSKNSWSEILLQLQLPRACINGSVALKQIYLRYLDRWEKVHFLHEEGDRASDDDEESRHKRWSARTLHCVPYTYNYNQHNVSETNREYNHLATNLYKSSDYDRLALSLISPLPNEQDFAINVCTLLSNDGKHTLKLQKHPRLITYLLGHAGVFNHSSLRNLFVHFYSDIRKQPIHNFWRDVVEAKDFLELTNENNFKLRRDVDDVAADAPPKEGADAPPKEGADAPPKEAADAATALLPTITPMEVDAGVATTVSPPSEAVCTVQESDSESEDETLPKDSDCDNVKATYDDADDNELFGLKRSLGTQDYVGQRVLQIATILRNLSFIEENITLLVKNTSFIRFLLLCCTSQWNILRNLGMDMLGNLAPEFIVKDLQTDVLAMNLLKVVTKGLQGQDRACCLSALEVLNKLSQNEKNEDILLRSLEPEVYISVCSFLTIHDVMLLIYTLECLYSLSSLGERSCHLIVNNHGVIDTLVSLVTVEGKSYGPKACIGMKLVETLPSGSSQAQQQTSSTTSSSTTTTTTTVSTATTTTASTTTPIVSTTPATRVTTPTTPARPVSVAPQRLIAMTPAPTPPPPAPPTVCVSVPTVTMHQVSQQAPVPVQPLQPAVSTHPMTPQQLIQQQHAHQQAIHENEQFALAWLRAAYEPCLDGGKVDHQELYRHYMNSCSKIGRRGVISPLHFPRCVRSVFGGTVGPNPMKPQHPNDPQYYEGIKVRDNPLVISMQQQQQQQQHTSVPKINLTTFAAAKGQQARRKSTVQTAAAAVPLTVSPVEGVDSASQVSSPASPILKAQLSAPPKQRESVIATSTASASSKGDMKSQAMAHPHLSQALLGTVAATAAASSVASAATVTVVASSCGAPSNAANQTSSTSLIKSLLATKVNDCMSTTVSMRTATDCQNVAQVAARQQRLLAQGGAASTPDHQQKIKSNETPKICRMNGVRQLFNDNEVGDPSVSSTTQFTSLIKGKKEPPQPPPPPLAPLSNNVKAGGGKTQRIDNEDSDSIGNNSVASSSGIGTVGIGGISSTEDGDNSLTCFEGLLNGIPSIDQHALNDDSNSKDSVRNVSSEMAINKPLRLADLLEKKFEKSPPLLNGTMGKDLKMGDKAMDLVENHIEKALSREADVIVKEEPVENAPLPNLKRSASDENVHVDAKKPMLSSNFNGSTNADSPSPDSVDEIPFTVSSAAAKLFADIAADILEYEEEEEQLRQEVQVPTQMIEQTGQVQVAAQSPLQQIIVDNNQQVLLTQPRQIIVSQSQPTTQVMTNQVMINTGTPMKTQTGQTVIVQNTGGCGGQRPVMLQQANAGQFMLQQGQMQLVHQPGGHQYVLQTSGSQGAYVVAAQPQTAVVHGQPQTVLVAQTQQQQGAPAKTIIILQQQAAATPQPTHHQKVVVTPQGQQVVVTQVPRPIAHTSSMSNNAAQCSGKVATKNVVTSVGVTQTVTANGTTDKRKEDVKPKLKVVRDLTTPYVCEWGECNVETKFKSANEVYLHVCACHCPTGNEEIVCLWDRCDNMKRKRFSLMTHLHDKHCNAEAMRQGLIRRKQAAHSAKVETTTPPSSSPHPGYAPDAALHAIKRHALEFVNPKELQDDNEGPVTKSIRLTASLILRNLVIYSSHCKRYLKSYESHLANVALSNVESSRTIAQVLYDMNDGSTHR